MNYTIKNPSDIGVYVQTRNIKTISAVKNAIDADVICNFQLFDTRTGKASYALKADGKIIGWDGANYWGFGWNKGDKTFSLDYANNMAKYENFAGCIPIVRDGKIVKLKSGVDYPSELGGKRGRTCIGVKKDGSIVIYCWADGSTGACRMDDLGAKMVALGCVNAINFDGGGSTQLICPNGKVTTSRPIYNFLWFKLPKAQADKCPYAEPTSLVKYGSRGEGAKWVQWYLNKHNKHGAKLVVDGIFGAKSVAALRAFQRANGLTVDGLCGRDTRTTLKRGDFL